jgi:hypothetical protein
MRLRLDAIDLSLDLNDFAKSRWRERTSALRGVQNDRPGQPDDDRDQGS